MRKYTKFISRQLVSAVRNSYMRRRIQLDATGDVWVFNCFARLVICPAEIIPYFNTLKVTLVVESETVSTSFKNGLDLMKGKRPRVRFW